MLSPASSTICGTPGVRKNAKPYMATCIRIFGKNGAWRRTRAHSVQRNGSIWNSRKTAAGFWWSGPSRYMTDDASETGTGIRPRPQGICHQPPRRGITDNSHDLFSEHTFAGRLEERIPPAGIAAPPGQGW